MGKSLALGLTEALRLTLERIAPLETETIELGESVDRVTAADLIAQIDSPSVDASLKDGYAVVSREVAAAGPEHPVRLQLAGCAAAGGRQDLEVVPGTTVRVLTGAKIPAGADAVVAEEFTSPDGDTILFTNDAHPGRNILPRGTDVAVGTCIVQAGRLLNPGLVGLLAASGLSRIPAVRRPEVAIVATGDEVVAPGRPLPEGKLYASNITALGAWCRRYKMGVHSAIVKDEADEVFHTLQAMAGEADALITSGGAWTGDRDMVARILNDLGWERVFHRIRIGPGKAVGFGLLDHKPVFVLPGGPPSNLMGFLQIALPGLMQLAGHSRPGLPRVMVELTSDLRGKHVDWTQFIFGTVDRDRDIPRFHPLRTESRLQDMGEAEAVVAIPEGETLLPSGTVVAAQVLE